MIFKLVVSFFSGDCHEDLLVKNLRIDRQFRISLFCGLTRMLGTMALPLILFRNLEYRHSLGIGQILAWEVSYSF